MMIVITPIAHTPAPRLLKRFGVVIAQRRNTVVGNLLFNQVHNALLCARSCL